MQQNATKTHTTTSMDGIRTGDLLVVAPQLPPDQPVRNAPDHLASLRLTPRLGLGGQKTDNVNT